MATRWRWWRLIALLAEFPFLSAALLGLAPAYGPAQETVQPIVSSPVLLASPNNRLQAEFTIVRGAPRGGGGGALVYSLKYDGKPLVDTSPLSLDLSGEPPLGTEVRIADSTSGSSVDDYQLIGGKTNHVHDPYNNLKLQVVEPNEPRRTFIIEAHAYNDGLAFRYVVPKQNAIQGGQQDLFYLQDFHLRQEHTEFRVS